MTNVLSPIGFLRVGGLILLVLGWLGYLLVPVTEGRLLGDALWFDAGENFGHTLLGIVALVFAADLAQDWQRWIVALLGIIALLFGIYGFVLPAGMMDSLNTFGVANLENPLDNIIHLVVGAWGLYAAFGPGATTS